MDIKIDHKNITSQELLRRVESLCVQEEPPFCTAACPLSIDVRELCALVAAGDFDGAYARLNKASPFMRIISRTCPGHCGHDCKRSALGGAIEVNLLERAVIDTCDKESKPPLMLPKKTQRIGVIGGGLRGMSAAWHLARKGYKITIFEASDRLGGGLWQLTDALPKELLERDIKALLAHPVEVLYNSRAGLKNAQSINSFAAENGLDAVYVSSGLPAEIALGEYSAIDCSVPAVGQCALVKTSTAEDVAAGRAASITLDRLIQGVSPGAGREREGVVSTRLYTDTEGIVAVDPVAPAGAGYSRTEAVAEAARCIGCECMECVKECPFMQRHGAYPRKYVREVYNNLSITMGTHHANGMINTCAMCGQCGAVCPNGLDMKDMFLAARRHMTESGKMPASAFEFALLDMEYSMSDEAFLAKPAPGRTDCEYLFFPGCQLGASEPELVTQVYRELLKIQPSTGLLLGCCGIMALWSGDNARFDAAVIQLRSAWEALGRPKVVTGCLNCAQTLREHCGMDAVGVWEIFTNGESSPTARPKNLTLRHACGGRREDGVFDSVSRFAASLGYKISEKSSAELSACCGYGGLLAFSDEGLADEFARADDSAEPILTYCINCRDMLLKNGGESYYLLELLCHESVPLRRRWPTWSERQDNRRDLRVRALGEFWGEKIMERERMKLNYSPELADKLDREHILQSDIFAVVEAAEASGRKFKKGENFLACHRPKNVTFWVEYFPSGDGFEIINAYAHRMEFELTSTSQ